MTIQQADQRAQMIGRLMRRRCCKMVFDRVLRLNPNGVAPGMRYRGWYRKRKPWVDDLVTRTDYEARHGRGTFALLPVERLVRDGRRRYTRREDLEDASHRRTSAA
jgi:hypothetical protein